MKNVQKISILLLSTIFLFTACQKEELPNTTPQETEPNERPTATAPKEQNDPTVITNPEPLVTIVRDEAICTLEGQNLQVYQVKANGKQIPINLSKYYVEWFNGDYELQSEKGELQCAIDGLYQVIVWDKITGETSARGHEVNMRTGDLSPDA